MGEGTQRLPGPRPTFGTEGREDTLPSQKLAAASGWIGIGGHRFRYTVHLKGLQQQVREPGPKL
jgi:hypothetical protein